MIGALIIDDQADGREAVRLNLERHCPDISVVEVCESAEQGMRAVKNHQPDLVFLDIQMPNMSGFDLLEQLESIDFEVIFVTAHNQYAIKAIKFSALDYLLKPIDPVELIEAVNKVKERQNQKDLIYRYESMLKNVKNMPGNIEKLAVSSMDGILFLETADIIYCSADGNYTKIYLTDKRSQMVSKKLKEFENMLSESGFCRVHHASLINLKHVHQYFKGEGGYVSLTDGHHVDVSRRRKEAFLSLLDRI
ncbi:MAG: LytR/AlgR family response regulator transcription factor [Cyclobacteriaceae bacterium]